MPSPPRPQIAGRLGDKDSSRGILRREAAVWLTHLEGGVYEAQVGVVLRLGVHAGAYQALDGLFDRLQSHVGGSVLCKM